MFHIKLNNYVYKIFIQSMRLSCPVVNEHSDKKTQSTFIKYENPTLNTLFAYILSIVLYIHQDLYNSTVIIISLCFPFLFFLIESS